MIGYSGSFAINGTNLALQPSEYSWMEREEYGMSGQLRPIYSAVREFEMKFALEGMSDFNQLLGFYNSVSTSGTVSVDLPDFTANDFLFKSYSGCTLREPAMSSYFNGYPSEVSIKILGIKTI